MKTSRLFLLTLFLLASLTFSTVAQDAIQRDTCPGLLASRLVRGARGRVLEGAPNRLRLEPSIEAEILVEIPAGYTFTVLAGPTCAEDIAWWQVRYSDMTGWTAEGQGDTYWIEPSLLPELEPITAANASRLQPLATLGANFISDVVWSPDGHTLLAVGSAGLWRYDLTQPDALPYLVEGYEGFFRSVAYSSDGKFVVTGSDMGAIRLWDTATWTTTAYLQSSGASVEKLTFSADGQQLASGSYDGTLQLWNMTSRSVAAVWAFEDGIREVAFSPDSRSLVAIHRYDKASLFNLHTFASIELEGLQDGGSIAFSADGKMLVIGNEQANHPQSFAHVPLNFFDVETGELLNSIWFKPLYSVYSLAFGNQGELIIGDWDVTDVWQIEDLLAVIPLSMDDKRQLTYTDRETPMLYIERKKFPYRSFPGGKFFRLNPARTRLAILKSDSTIQLVDLETDDQNTILQLPLFEQAIQGKTEIIDFSPTQPLMAFGSYNDIQLMNTATGIAQSVLTGHELDISALAFNPTGELLASGSSQFALAEPSGWGEEGGVRIWDMTDASLKSVFYGYSNPVKWLRFSADSNLLFTAFDYGGYNNEEKAFFLWDWKTDARTLLDETIDFVSFSPNEPIAALVNNDQEFDNSSVDLLDTGLNLQTSLLKNSDEYLGDAVFSPDGKLLFVASTIWNIQTGEAVNLDHSYNVAVFSPDNSLLAYYDYIDLIIWDIATQTERLRIEADNFSNPVFFNTDGSLILTGSKLYDIQTGAIVADLTPPRKYGDFYLIYHISADGKIIAVVDGFGIRLWAVPQS